jgi:hypothetical protein
MSKKMERVYAIRQQMAAAAGRTRRHEIAQEAIATVAGTTASIKIDRSRITLAKLRFMGEEPDPVREEPTE